MSYTTLAAVKADLGIGASNTDFDSIITAKIAAAQAEIDRFCGRRFEAITTTRNYSQFYPWFGSDERVLLLDDDLLTCTALANGDGTTIPSGGYWLEPQSAGRYSSIRLKSAYSWAFSNDGSVQVTGTWGYSATAPADIVELCKELAIYLYRLKDVSNLTATTLPDGGDTPIPIDLPKHVKSALASYRSLVI